MEMIDVEKVINKITMIVADMQEEVDEWKDYSDSELRGGLTCDCDWWYKTLQTLKDALALLKAQEPEAMDAPKPDSDIGCWYDITHNYTLEQVVSALKAQESVKPRVGHDGWYKCGCCNNSLASGERVKHFYGHPWPKYCEECGRKVKWDG